MPQDRALFDALHDLEVDYWYDVDHHWGRSAHELYTEGGVFAIGAQRMAGREAVRQFYAWRAGRGARVARHVVTNVRVRSDEPGKARLECIMLLYAADGTPVLDSRPAIMIADIVSDCVLGDDGRWRYESHLLHPLFMGGEAPTLPPQ